MTTVRGRAIALLMLALGFTVVVPGAGADVSSRVATSGTAAAAPTCSKAAATALVKRLHLGSADYVPTPVSGVICGPFMGPASRTMVALLVSGGASSTFGGWAVFRPDGGSWRLVLERIGGGRITAAGSALRETQWIMREGDSHCCPTGGSKARLWRWNGTRFAAGAWKQVTPAAPAPAVPGFSGFFKTPSGNIVCGYGHGSKFPVAFVACRIRSGLEPPPRPTRPGCFTTDDIGLRATGRTTTGRTICPGEPEGDAGVLVYESVARVLVYGRSWSGGGISCTSAVAGLTCRNKSGHGFFLSRARWRAF